MRIFISIDMPGEIINEIRKIQDKLPEFFGKKTESENLHLTLKFLGEVDEEKLMQVKERLKEIKIKKLESCIDSIGIFSEKFVRIIWLHLNRCDELQKEIDNKLGNLFVPEKRFMSHLTIARVKSLKDKEKFLRELKNIKIDKIKFIVEKFKLKKSVLNFKKPVYETLEEYNLN